MQYWMSNRHKILYTITLIANSIAFLLGAIYLIWNPDNSFTNIMGVYLMIVLLINIIQAYVLPRYDKKGYLYLSVIILSMFLMAITNSLLSFLPIHNSSRSIFSSMAILALFAFGALIAGLNLFKRKSDIDLLLIQIDEKHEDEPKKQKTLRYVSIAALSILFIIGLFISHSILFDIKLWRTEVFISAYSLFYAYMFLSIGLLLIKLIKFKRKNYIKNLGVLLSLIIFIICIFPSTRMPSLIASHEMAYSNAFASDDESVFLEDSNNFRQNRFSIPEYFFGTLSNDYTVKRNIPFYTPTEGIDKELNLCFDVYTSNKEADALPGGNSVLIRIHGGEWTYGDKGFLNNAQMNKYFASKGYVVFDIQYGLSNINNSLLSSTHNQNRYGEYKIEDMVRHIGKFTQYLAENHEEFNANIDSVFISGCSAGGNLALVSALTASNQQYDTIIDPDIRIAGIIPFYPANDLAQEMGIVEAGSLLADPSSLINKNSPPCLIFQGQNDGIVKPSTTKRLEEKYREYDNKECAIIIMPFGGHSCDIYFPGYYNQTFLFYMERFMFYYR